MTDKSILTLQHPGEPATSTKIDTKGYVSETTERVIAQANEIHKLRMENKFLLESKAEIQAAAIDGFLSQVFEGCGENSNITVRHGTLLMERQEYIRSLTASKEG